MYCGLLLVCYVDVHVEKLENQISSDLICLYLKKNRKPRNLVKNTEIVFCFLYVCQLCSSKIGNHRF